uniref:Anthranilate synthase component 2 n=1 Tax=Platysiphonia delicata TaxID=2006979 RepID=A0A1Z1M159_9FLOR|nr:Anthranilate synthase component II [Platysiphonia delicata]ARW59515.1 Anthranilate synthase component II [Platysiphonia delicata]
MIIIIDNYDSFTQNLVQQVGDLKFSIKTFRNDEISLNEIIKINPTHILLSPGPGRPENSGICLEIVSSYASKIPILGVCLGHQSIGYVYGTKIKQLKTPMHGKTSEIFHNQQNLFKKVNNPFKAVRYHSLIIDEESMHNNLIKTAWTKDGLIMACKHRQYEMLQGIQFHPESLWTESGKIIVKNFLSF